MESTIDHVCVSGTWFTVLRKQPFAAWLESTTKVNFTEFMRQSRKDRETVFLRWKHGCSDDSNVNIEASEADFIRTIRRTDFSRHSPEYRYWAASKLRFYRHCQKVMAMIGLGPVVEMTQEAKATMQYFGGKVVGV